MSASKPRVLVVLTSANKIPKTGKGIGWCLPELAHPYGVLKSGAELVYASPKGGEAPLDHVTLHLFKDDPVCKHFPENNEPLWKNTVPLSDLAGRASEFNAIFYPGGHGSMVDLVDDQYSKGPLRDFHAQGKIISTVCHGLAAFINAITAGSESILKGKQVTGFDDKLNEASGGTFVKAADGPLAEKVVVDGNIITGQNPASSKGLGEAIAKALRIF
ncbi:hypothetical protein ACHAPJ_009842 [Fusarium lateritium]